MIQMIKDKNGLIALIMKSVFYKHYAKNYGVKKSGLKVPSFSVVSEIVSNVPSLPPCREIDIFTFPGINQRRIIITFKTLLNVNLISPPY